jgi:hypothetical protein
MTFAGCYLPLECVARPAISAYLRIGVYFVLLVAIAISRIMEAEGPSERNENLGRARST